MKLPELRKIRTAKGYSQEYMGNKLAMSQRHYGRLEKEERAMTMKLFIAICKILDVEPPELLRPNENRG